MEQVLEQQLMAAASMVEQQLDSEIDKLDKLDKDEIEVLREKRIAAMKRAQDQKKTWIANGHGKWVRILIVFGIPHSCVGTYDRFNNFHHS